MPNQARFKGLVTLAWTDRTFVEGAEETITLPFPVVGISTDVIAAIEADCGVALGQRQHRRLEELVERRIFNVCGFTSLGADARENVVPTRVRPEALRVAETARDLVAALDRFDAALNGRGGNNFEHHIKRLVGADPRKVIEAVAALYSRYVPTAPEEKQRGRAVFIADLRDQIVALTVPKRTPATALLVRFLIAVDQHVLRPLDRLGIAPPDVESLPIRRRKRRKALSAALVRGGGNAESAIEKVIRRDLSNYDAECTAAEERLVRAFAIAGQTKRPG